MKYMTILEALRKLDTGEMSAIEHLYSNDEKIEKNDVGQYIQVNTTTGEKKLITSVDNIYDDMWQESVLYNLPGHSAMERVSKNRICARKDPSGENGEAFLFLQERSGAGDYGKYYRVYVPSTTIRSVTTYDTNSMWRLLIDQDEVAEINSEIYNLLNS